MEVVVELGPEDIIELLQLEKLGIILIDPAVPDKAAEVPNILEQSARPLIRRENSLRKEEERDPSPEIVHVASHRIEAVLEVSVPQPGVLVFEIILGLLQSLDKLRVDLVIINGFLSEVSRLKVDKVRFILLGVVVDKLLEKSIIFGVSDDIFIGRSVPHQMEAVEFFQRLGFEGRGFDALVDHSEVCDSFGGNGYDVVEFVVVCL